MDPPPPLLRSETQDSVENLAPISCHVVAWKVLATIAESWQRDTRNLQLPVWLEN